MSVPATSGSSVLNTTTAGAASAQTASGLSTLTSNFQNFLSLLTTQLQNQDPTNPMDTNQFTQQLVEMTGVQQQLLSNNLLTTLVAQGQGGLSNAVSYIGDTVQATDSNETLSGGKATWDYNLASQAASATITISDSSGNTVWSGPAPSLNSGVSTFTWNGQDSSGTQLQDGGTYTMKVTATDAANNPVTSQVLTVGTATAATVINGSAYVTVNGQSVPASSIVSVQPPSSASGSGGSNNNNNSSGS
jgi:flagellar basal-body rod modification protein FlgD